MNSKIKLLKILDILTRTSEKSPITAQKICQLLKEYGIDAERKSVCRDINNLKSYGYDIVLCHDNKKGYYMKGQPLTKKSEGVTSKNKITVTVEYKKENEKEVKELFKDGKINYEGDFATGEFLVSEHEVFLLLLKLKDKGRLIYPENLAEEFKKTLMTTLDFYNKPRNNKKLDVWLL